MYRKLLSKELVRKKTMNSILMIFIVMASMFLGSAVQNLMVSTTAVGRFFEKAKVADEVVIMAGTKAEMAKWEQSFSECKEIQSWGKDEAIIGVDNYLFGPDNKRFQYKNSDMSVYLIKNPKEHSIIFDQKNQKIVVHDGEIAIPTRFANSMGFKMGDTITFIKGQVEKKFKICGLTKDAGFDTSLAATSRLVLSDQDYKELSADFDVKVNFYHVMTDDVKKVADFYSEKFSGYKVAIGSELLKMCYIFDIMVAAIMITVSICLLIVAFVILRFSILFTIEDDYMEIGVLKAIGIPDKQIQRLYMVKYLVLAVVGSFVGWLLSIPFGRLLNQSLEKNIILIRQENLLWVNGICSLFVIVLVTLFCTLSTKKLRKVSAIEAIRCGAKGESYHRKSVFPLKKSKRMGATWVMAMNDVFGSVRRYVVIVLTFLICILLLMIPMVAVETMKSPESSLKLLGEKSGQIYVYVPDQELMVSGNRTIIQSYLQNMEDELEKHEIEATVAASAYIQTKMKNINEKGNYSIHAVMDINGNKSYIEPVKGTKMKYKNEFMMSENAQKEYGAVIGNTYEITIGEQTFPLILTGIYDNMNNLGKTIHIHEDLSVDFAQVSAISPATIFLKEHYTGDRFEKEKQTIKGIFPDQTVYNESEYASNFMGSYIQMFDHAKKIVMILVISVVFLVSILMIKSFVSRETSELALLKSLGFSKRRLRLRYMYRIVICLMIALLLAYVVSIPVSQMMIRLVFQLFGTNHTTPMFDSLAIFVWYPMMILGTIIVSGWLGTQSIQKISTRQVNMTE